MSDFEFYSEELLLASKQFLQEAKVSGLADRDQQRYLRASLTHVFFFLEAQLNYLAGHFSGSTGFDLLERSLLSERDVRLDNGKFVLTDNDKFFRIEDRIEFLLYRFSADPNKTKGHWFSDLKSSINVRNRLVHPKKEHKINVADVEKAIMSVLNCLTSLYYSIFRKDFPLSSLGLHTGPM